MKPNFNLYNAHTADLKRRDLSSTEKYDTAILIWSVLALTSSLFSMYFVRGAEDIFLLQMALVFSVFTGIASLCAYLASHAAIAFSMARASEYYLACDEDALEKANKFIKFNDYLNTLTFACLVASLLSILSFALLSL